MEWVGLITAIALIVALRLVAQPFQPSLTPEEYDRAKAFGRNLRNLRAAHLRLNAALIDTRRKFDKLNLALKELSRDL